MRIKKYDLNYSRRVFLEKTLKGAATAGVLAPLWPSIVMGADMDKVYPEELLTLEAYTKGKVKEGDVITAENVDLIKELLDPIQYIQVKEQGRRINIVKPVKDMSQLFPHEYLEATIKNEGLAQLDDNGNVVNKDGKPWIGGNPFPNAKTGNEVISNLTLSWGRHDQSVYAIRDWDLSPDGDVSYQYDLAWAEENMTCRIGPEGPYKPGEEDKLRYQSVIFTAPNDTKGSAFLNTWHYDQRKYPDLVGYVPAFKRVRKFPTNQRFEPLVPGMTFFLSDAWAAGDPMLTWGNYKIIARRPGLGAVSQNWYGDHENWERPVHGGPKDQTFFETQMEFIPEVIVLESEPVGFPRAPVGKRHTYVDARNGMYIGTVNYDRRGELWKSFEPGYSQHIKGDIKYMDGNHVGWSWTYVMSHDIQSNRMTRFVQAKKIKGGVTSSYNDKNTYDKYLTVAAMRRFGR